MIDELIRRHGILSDQITKAELAVLLRECQKVLEAGVPGDIVELGCYEGTTSVYLQRLITHNRSDAKLHLYDSFEGLPDKSGEDNSPAGEQFKHGELRADKARLINNFKHAGLPVPRIKKAWFAELTPADMPEKVAFAFLDGDFYQSILDSLALVWPHLSEGAVVVVDDYQAEGLPGVKRAVEEWRVRHSFRLRIEASLAVITRLANK